MKICSISIVSIILLALSCRFVSSVSSKIVVPLRTNAYPFWIFTLGPHLDQFDPPFTGRFVSLATQSAYEAWAAYDPVARGVALGNGLRQPQKEATFENKNIAISYAIFRVAQFLLPELNVVTSNVMVLLGLDPLNNSTKGNNPISVGNRAGFATIKFALLDGFNDIGQLRKFGVPCTFNCIPFDDYTDYRPVNPFFELLDPDRWQPLTDALTFKPNTISHVLPHVLASLRLLAAQKQQCFLYEKKLLRVKSAEGEEIANGESNVETDDGSGSSSSSSDISGEESDANDVETEDRNNLNDNDSNADNDNENENESASDSNSESENANDIASDISGDISDIAGDTASGSDNDVGSNGDNDIGSNSDSSNDSGSSSDSGSEFDIDLDRILTPSAVPVSSSKTLLTFPRLFVPATVPAVTPLLPGFTLPIRSFATPIYETLLNSLITAERNFTVQSKTELFRLVDELFDCIGSSNLATVSQFDGISNLGTILIKRSYIQKHITPQLRFTKPFGFRNANEIQVRPNPVSFFRTPKAYEQQAREVIRRSAGLTDHHKMEAEHFDAKSRFWILSEFVSQRFNFSFDEFVLYEFLTSRAIMDALIFAFSKKLEFDTLRPVSAIRFLFGDQLIRSWGGPGRGTVKMFGSDFYSYLFTQPHSEYPSATTCICTAFAQVSRLFLGTDELEFAFVYPKGSSVVEPGFTPQKDVTLYYKTWTELVNACGESRVNGGVHFPNSVRAAKESCTVVGTKVYEQFRRFLGGKAKPLNPKDRLTFVPGKTTVFLPSRNLLNKKKIHRKLRLKK